MFIFFFGRGERGFFGRREGEGGGGVGIIISSVWELKNLPINLVAIILYSITDKEIYMLGKKEYYVLRV